MEEEQVEKFKKMENKHLSEDINYLDIKGLSLEARQKLNKIKEIANTPGLYAAIEVKGNQGEHWVALDSVNGNSIRMIDPGTNNTDMWSTYNWVNTSQISYYKVS